MASGGSEVKNTSVIVDNKNQPIPFNVSLEPQLQVKATQPPNLYGNTQTGTGFQTPNSKSFDPSIQNSTMIGSNSSALTDPLHTEPFSPVITGRGDLSNDTVTFNPQVTLNIKNEAKEVIINKIDDPDTSLTFVGNLLSVVQGNKMNTSGQDQESELRQEYEQRQKALIQNYEQQLADLNLNHEAALGSEKHKYQEQIQSFQLTYDNRIYHVKEQKDQEMKTFRAQQQKEIETIQAQLLQKQREIESIQAQLQFQIDNLQAQLQSQKLFYENQIQSLKRSQTAPNPVGTHNQANIYTRAPPFHSTMTSLPPQNFSIPPPDISRIQSQAFSINPLNQSFIDSFASSQDKLAESIKQSMLANLNSAPSYDGNDPQKFQNWLDEVTRLQHQYHTDFLTIAITTSRGQLNKHLMKLKEENFDWEVIKSKLRERFSDCTSIAAAQNKLTKLKQNNSSLHEYIAKFTELLEYGHKLKPSDSTSKVLANYFIDGLSDSYKYTKSKLREKTGDSLEFFFNEAISLQHKQEIRSIDFGEPKQTSLSECEIQAMRTNTCYKCGSEDHFIRDCPKPNSNTNACFKCGSQEHFARNCTNDNQNSKTGQFKQDSSKSEEPNSMNVELLLKKIADLVSQKSNSENSTKPKSYHNKHSHRHNHKHHNQGKFGKSNYNRNKSHVQANVIEDTDDSYCSDSCEEGEGNTVSDTETYSKN